MHSGEQDRPDLDSGVRVDRTARAASSAFGIQPPNLKNVKNVRQRTTRIINYSYRNGIRLITPETLGPNCITYCRVRFLCAEERGEMTQRSGAAFDPKTITLLKNVLAEAEQTLPVQKRSSEARVKLATGILTAAAEGERDPARLRAAGLHAVQ